MTLNASLEETMNAMGAQAAIAARELGRATTEQKNKTLIAAAQNLRAQTEELLTANRLDMDIAKEAGLNNARLDRIALDAGRVEGIAKALEDVAALPDPVGDVMARWDRPNGLDISRVRVPLGVIGVIYESRPNVTADAAALCLKSGNAVILRGSSEIQNSAKAVAACFDAALEGVGLPKTCVQLVPTPDREAVGMMLAGLEGTIDVIVPRGGKSLVERVQNDARVPVFSHLDGICHTYIHASADLEMAKDITLNAKLRRTGICGATETLLLDRQCAGTHLKPLVEALLDEGCEVRGDEDVASVDERVVMATAQDWDTEYLDSIISIKLIEGVEDAISHIASHGSGHTEAIISEDASAAEAYLNGVDSAIVMHNASTQFADGGEFGMGAEIGIATGRFHARGPVGLEQLTTFKYQVRGSGQTRPR
ncbi:MAG: glutamate-5-semialdehyde dehydrogenase [PS1 clade bacterium]|uniref:Gamma-glutamyl phosphate reductase n=1 Tax=PS1 clade bacterium TaxID=2175152 RepID=A0A368E157_9PROT|nr:MAG: glutamate-5-semialdehyde dehydrogenase [PS1 clade bacterium]HAK97836.1 glutamate-5-semialdehyde dehydrogenase [Rhodobiaceae bacterium]HCV48480.1 glutamate-5-semialdehyde dehydrogenase [Rhodobiaceae bacterium]|tara:strand:- start:652 stop:1926 length:1275 start_codon:yes stop_codon:yes gene_type:complete